MTNCQKCGARVDSEDEFCPDCGARILPAGGVAARPGLLIAAQPGKRTFLRIFLVVIGVMLVVAVFSYIIGQSQVTLPNGGDSIPVPPLDIDADPSLGPIDATVTIVEYSDFECPFCLSVQPTLQQVMDEYEGDVRLVFKNYPLNIHANAFIAAEAGECANEQGGFWDMHDIMFSNQPGLGAEYLKKYAEEIALDIEKFSACLDSEKYKAEVERDIAEGSSLGFTGVPVFFINGRLLSGAQPIEAFRNVIDEALFDYKEL